MVDSSISWYVPCAQYIYPLFAIYTYFKKLNFNLGRFKNFWGHDNLKPTWWHIPFVCIFNSKKHRITKELLINFVASYQQYYDIKPISKANANLEITTSTLKKRRLPVSTESDISPLGKRVKVLENSFSQLDNTSYSGGLLNTSQHTHS